MKESNESWANDDDGLIHQVVDEFMTAVERKDKSMMMEALRALILHIQHEDEKSDAAEESDEND